jgi:hypothetical protein
MLSTDIDGPPRGARPPAVDPVAQSWLSGLTSRVLMNILSQLPRKTALAATQCCRTLYETHADLVDVLRLKSCPSLHSCAYLTSMRCRRKTISECVVLGAIIVVRRR